MMSFSVASKVALVTGGSGGLGSHICKELLKKGLKGVAILGTNVERGLEVQNEIRQAFGENSCLFIKTDVAQQSQLEAAFKLTVDTFKQLDIVINNAGIISEINWQKCLEVNLGGCIAGTKLAIDTYLPKYKSGSEGVVVNISSILGLQPLGVTPVYTATKQGIVAISRAFGVKEHYERTKVRVLTICPGHMATSLILEPQMENLNIEYITHFNVDPDDYPMQSPEFVAQAISNIINEGENGSVWLIEGGQAPQEIIFQDRFHMCKNKL